MTHHFRAADGRLLAYEDTGGDGPAIVCLAGLTRNSRDFGALARHLSDSFRVIRLDSRGRGKSEHAADPLSEYTVPVEAGDAIALLDHLGLQRVALVGTSRGGILSMAIASGQPGRVSAIVLNDVGAVVEGRGLLRILATLGRQPRAATFAEAAADLAEANRREFPDVAPAEWEDHARCIYDDADGRPVLSYDPHLRAAVAAAIDTGEGRVTLWPLFEALKTLPVLLVHGENSDILLKETVERMRQVHPGLEVLELPNRGHAPFLTEPPALDAIKAFLLRHA